MFIQWAAFKLKRLSPSTKSFPPSSWHTKPFLLHTKLAAHRAPLDSPKDTINSKPRGEILSDGIAASTLLDREGQNLKFACNFQALFVLQFTQIGNLSCYVKWGLRCLQNYLSEETFVKSNVWYIASGYRDSFQTIHQNCLKRHLKIKRLITR